MIGFPELLEIYRQSLNSTTRTQKTAACNLKFHAKAIVRQVLSDDRFCVKFQVTGNRLLCPCGAV